MLQIRIRKAVVPTGTPDPSYVVKSHLRAGDVVGSAAVKARAAGKPVALKAGGVGETVALQDIGSTPLDALAKRIVPGMRLRTYTRGASGASSKRDAVEGELDGRAISVIKGGAGDSTVHLFADLAPPTAGDRRRRADRVERARTRRRQSRARAGRSRSTPRRTRRSGSTTPTSAPARSPSWPSTSRAGCPGRARSGRRCRSSAR